ncbi:MAG: hypothetical protein LBI12_08110 [Treponema sp.]|jgi:Leucine-rich repeat (LRR) protein|nr:hypothetical protein [Treponema sp.]
MEELDLHWVKEDKDLGIASEGVLCKDMDDIIRRISEVKDTVKKINLDNQRALKQIPGILNECKQLEDLNISHTSINEIPEFLFAMPNLRFLSCRCSELTQFPKNISKAEKLEKLNFRVNKDCSFPKEISSIQSLKKIAVDLYSSASSLPEDLGNLKNLESFNLFIKYDEGAVPALPSSFNDHPALKKININDPFHKYRKSFALEKTIQILSSCHGLESLKLSGLAVGTEHQNLSRLSELKKLELRHLFIEGNIFDSITELHNLEELFIFGSEFRITEIPDMFSNMNNLRVFSFAGNMVLDLPPSFYSLANLTTMEIGSTGISALDNKIENLKNLESLHIYDNILERLPSAVFALPNLKILNIDENIFNKNEIAAINETIKALAQKGRKIEFSSDGQGHRQMVKRLRALKNIEEMDIAVYAKYCHAAINENPFALKYINNNKLHDTKLYAEFCIAALRKTCLAMDNINYDLLGKTFYFPVCMEAARNQDITNVFHLIKDNLLTEEEYIQVCIEAALHNRNADFLNKINKSRFNRDVYERICWIAVLHYPPVITKMENPTKELHDLAVKRSRK